MKALSRRLASLCALCLGLALYVAPAHAGGTFNVNTIADQMDANPGDGVCATAEGGGVCSLRAAVMEANALGGVNVINLPAGVYNLGIFTGAEEEDDRAGDLDLSGDLTIAGAGASQTIVDSSAVGDRVFQVLSRARVTISGVTIRNGRPVIASVREGGGIYVDTARLTLDHVLLTHNDAGAIFSTLSTLIVTDTAIISNTGGFGAGIYSTDHATLKMTNSSVLDNTAGGAGGGIYSNDSSATLSGVTIAGNLGRYGGGGVFNNGAMTAVNTTISGNRVSPFLGAGGGAGGGIYNDSGQSLTLKNVTITDNSSTEPGGGLFNLDTGTLSMTNSIVARSPSGGNCVGTITSAGHNLDSDASCGFDQAGDHSNVFPLLGPLQDNGGPTPTHALLPGSPAINTGDNAGCPATDQRGVARPQDLICDIGSFERALGSYRIRLSLIRK
jgi:CSLREA domain-containing protein